MHEIMKNAYGIESEISCMNRNPVIRMTIVDSKCKIIGKDETKKKGLFSSHEDVYLKRFIPI